MEILRHHHYLAMAILAFLATTQADESITECQSLVTFNAQMAPSSGDLEQRRLQIPNALGVLDADVYCLQEYWQECDIEELVGKLENKYPHHVSILHEGVGNLTVKSRENHAPCSQDQARFFEDSVEQCAIENDCVKYLNQPGEDMSYGLFCLAFYCRDELIADELDAECFNCIIRYGIVNFADGITRCTPQPETCSKRHNAPGLVLLSKKPMTNVSYTSYSPDREWIVERGYLEANVEGLGKVVCTQLTPLIPLFLASDEEYEVISEELLGEIDNLTTIFEDVDHFLMGDFGAGPQLRDDGSFALSPIEYKRLVESGYRDPYSDQVGLCTYCQKDGLNVIIDHIFIRGYANTTSAAKRVLDAGLPFNGDGTYGVQVRVCPSDTA